MCCLFFQLDNNSGIEQHSLSDIPIFLTDEMSDALILP